MDHGATNLLVLLRFISYLIDIKYFGGILVLELMNSSSNRKFIRWTGKVFINRLT